ncbi:hypothetical protein TNCV_3659391 [Trichonephila clavipes]|nr:hypothetical protein TNCV_3659391 [Trichonephila clavipes]
MRHYRQDITLFFHISNKCSETFVIPLVTLQKALQEKLWAFHTEEALNGYGRKTPQQVNSQDTDASFVRTLGTCSQNCDTMSKLKEALRKRQLGLIRSSVLLLDDSATAMQNHIAFLGWECLPIHRTVQISHQMTFICFRL